MGGKIIITEESDTLQMEIIPSTKPWQRVMVGIWLMLWIFCGGLVIAQMVLGPGDQRILLLVYLAFWAYFLLLGSKSFLWINYGSEKLVFKDCQFQYARNWGFYNKAQSFNLESIKNIEVVNYEGKLFTKTFNDSFWSFAGEAIVFNYFGKRWTIGAKLDEKEAKSLAKTIERLSKKCK